MSPPCSEIDVSVWKPTFPIQHGSVVASSLPSQPIPSTSYISVQ